MLSDIRDYLISKDAISVRDLALHFDVPPAAMEGMLNHWVRKGRVRKLSACGGCHGCGGAESELYTWVPVCNAAQVSVAAGCLCRS